MSNKTNDPQSLNQPPVESVSQDSPPNSSTSHENWIGMEVSADELFEQWSREDQQNMAEERKQKRSRFSVGRSPLMLVLVAGLSFTLSMMSYPALEAIFTYNQVSDCGDISVRRHTQNPTPFKHLERCHLTAYVGTSDLFAIGRATSPNDPDLLKSKEGKSYVVKLSGDQVYAILPAHDPMIDSYYARQGDLAGFGIDDQSSLNKGLMVNPKDEVNYQNLEQEIRNHLGLTLDQPLWFFDVTYDPWERKMPIVIALLGPIIALLALLSLKNELRLRRERAQEDAEDEAWVNEFSQEAENHNS